MLFATASWYIANNYGDIIKKAVVEQLNERLKSEVKVGEIQVSTWRKIPFFSLKFEDVVIFEPAEFSPSPDTLLEIEKVYFQFNLWDLYQGNYNLKRVDIENAKAIFKVDNKGRQNFVFWKEVSDSTKSDFNLALDQINLKSVAFKYSDKGSDFQFKTTSNQLKVHGNFSSEKLQLLINGSLLHTKLTAAKNQYLNDDNIQINTGLILETETNNLIFQKGNLLLNQDIEFTASGRITERTYSVVVDGNKITTQKLLRLLPEKYTHESKNYESKGILDFNMKLEGNLEGSDAPKVDVSFQMIDASIKHKDYPVSIDQLRLSGRFSNGQARSNYSSVLIMDSLFGSFPNGYLNGSCTISDFNNLNIKYSANGELDLDEIKQLFDVQSLDTLSGKVTFRVSGDHNLKQNFKEQLASKSINYSGWIEFEKIKLYPKNLRLKFKELHGKMIAQNRIWAVENMTGIVQSTDFSLSGNVSNVIPWLYDSSGLKVRADVQFGHIRLEEFFNKEKEANHENKDNYGPVHVLLKSSIDTLSQGKFMANAIKTTISIAPKNLVANPIKFSAMSGTVDGRLSVVEKKGYSDFKFQGAIEDVDITELFQQFDNFGQKEITDKNLKGSTNAAGRVYGRLVNGQIEPNTIDSRVELEIINGELIDYKSLISTADYFRSNLFLKTMFDSEEIEKRFRRIKFDRLQNEIYITEGKVIIPQMSVSSNFIGFNAAGTHDFNNIIDYHFDFDISDLMAKKREFDTDYGYVSDDGTGRYRVFLKMYGNASSPVIEVDKERKKAHKKNKRKDEENELKSVLKEEFGFYKNDTTVKRKEIEEEFEIEWEEAEEQDNTGLDSKKANKDLQSKSTSKKKGLKKFLKPIEHEKEEVEFEDDDY